MERNAMRWLVSLLTLVNLAIAASVPVATNPILTTITTTSTAFSVLTIGTSTSTTTPILCPDGSCIAISLVEVPILSTSTILDVGVVVNTVGFTTIYSSVPDDVSTTPAPAPADPTPSNPPAQTTSPPTSPSATASSTITTSTITSGTASGRVSVITVIQSASASAGANSQDASPSSGSNGEGLETKYIIIIAVLATVIGLAILGLFAFLLIKKRRRQQALKATTSTAVGGTGMTADDAIIGGRYEIGGHEKARPQVAEMNTATGDGYRGTNTGSAPSWAPTSQSGGLSELSGETYPPRSYARGGYRPSGVQELGGNARYEMR